MFAKVILSRIRPTLLAHRRPQQSGFTPGRSTCDRNCGSELSTLETDVCVWHYAPLVVLATQEEEEED